MKPPTRLKRPTPTARPKAAWRQALGGRARTAGHASEWMGALWLTPTGYQILGFKLKSRTGEIDIPRPPRACAGGGDQRRAALEAALAAVTVKQHLRLLSAGRPLLH